MDLMTRSSTFLQNVLFACLFAWISFFPEPVQGRHEFSARVGLFVFFCVIAICSKNKKQLFSLRDGPLWLFLIVLSGGIAAAAEKGVAFRTYLHLSYNLLMLFYIGKGMFLCEKCRNSVAFVICIFSSAVALFGILETLFAVNPLYVYFVENCFYERYITGVVRPMSTLQNPTVLGTYLLLAFPFGIYVLNQKNKIPKVLGFCSLVLTSTCLLLTFSRGAVLGAAAMMLFYLWLKKDRRRLLIFGLALILFFFAVEFLPYPFCRFTISTLLKGEMLGLFSSYRGARLEMVLRMLAQSPVLGIGFGHIRLLFHVFYPLKAQLPFTGFEHRIADNMHLTLAAETGILGLTGFFAFIFFLFKNGFQRFKSTSSKNLKSMLLITLSALAGFVVNMTGYEVFYWVNPYMFFCLICGFIQGLVDSKETS